MFIDRAEIYIRSGNGGQGCVSFLRERFRANGGPDGGDGGHGGDVILYADPAVTTLLDFAGKHHWIAKNGRPGEGKRCTGKSGKDIEVALPPGTLIYDRDTGRLLKDIDTPGMRVRIARGGRGGRGNERFKSARKQSPRYAQPGEPGEERWLRLELKLIADIGLLGLPNAGKSTLLSRVSQASPKIADYPFTTLEPQLGIVDLSGYRRFVMADIPGLIEGAHEGIGLGDDFLRHVERTRLLVHLVDIYPMEGQPAPEEAYRVIREELRKHSETLAAKPEIVVANKIDLTTNDDAVKALRDALETEVIAISGVTGNGLDVLTERIWEELQKIKQYEAEHTEEIAAQNNDPFIDVALPVDEPESEPEAGVTKAVTVDFDAICPREEDDTPPTNETDET